MFMHGLMDAIDIVSHYNATWHRTIDRSLKFFAQLLYDEAIDLEPYAAGETQILMSRKLWTENQYYYDHMQAWFYDPMKAWVCDLKHFQSGPRPSDWHFEYHSHEYDFAKDFWAMIERPIAIHDLLYLVGGLKRRADQVYSNQLPKTPGTWVEEIEDVTLCDLFWEFNDMDLDEYLGYAELVSEQHKLMDRIESYEQDGSIEELSVEHQDFLEEQSKRKWSFCRWVNCEICTSVRVAFSQEEQS